MTQKQLIDKAKRSNQDYLNGKYKTQDQMEQESNIFQLELTDEQLKYLDASKQQILNGQFVSHENLRKQFRKWQEKIKRSENATKTKLKGK